VKGGNEQLEIGPSVLQPSLTGWACISHACFPFIEGRQKEVFPQQLPGPAQPACAGELPQQEGSPDPGSPCLVAPDKEDGAESSFLRLTLPQALQVGESSDEETSTSLVSPHSTHKRSKSGMAFFFTSSGDFSVSAPTAGVSGAGEPGIELGQSLFQNKADVFTHSTFSHTVHSDSLSLQLHQGPHPDSSDRNRIHFASSQSFQRLAHTMSVVQIIVADFFNGLGLRIDDHKTRGGPKVFVYSALQSFQVDCGKTNLHAITPS
jgi:hypothetical protein